MSSWSKQSFGPKKDMAWFEQNMHAQCVKPLPLCSFCSVRNLKKFCNLLKPACMYCSVDETVVGSVIWVPNESGMGYSLECCTPPREMVDWFNSTSADEIKRIASQMAYDAIVKNSLFDGLHQCAGCMSQTKPASIDLRTIKLLRVNKQK